LIERDGISSISTSATVSASPIGQIARTIQLQAGVNTHISIGLGQLRSAVQVATPSVELSLKHPVTVSSVANESLGANAVDGDETTRWSSAYKDNEWIYVDLGNSKTINEIKLDWEHAAGKDYDMEVSDDATTWKTVKSVTNNSSMAGWIIRPQCQRPLRQDQLQGAHYGIWFFTVGNFRFLVVGSFAFSRLQGLAFFAVGMKLRDAGIKNQICLILSYQEISLKNQNPNLIFIPASRNFMPTAKNARP